MTKKEKDRERYHKIRAFVLKQLEGKSCVDCHTADTRVLQFDHIDPSTKVKEISDAVCARWGEKSLKKEMDKCVLRCANCHQIKSFKDNGSYRLK